MKKKHRIRISSIVSFFFALYAFYTLKPVFTWNTFMGGIFGEIAGLQFQTAFALVGVFAGLLIIRKKHYAYHNIHQINTKKIGGKSRIMLVLFLVGIAFCNVAISSNLEHLLTFVWMPYIVICVFILLPSEIQFNTYKMYYNVFSITLIIPIIVFCLLTIGVNVPYMPIQSYEHGKQVIGVSYNLYPFALARVQQYQTILYGRQLCAIYDEPGRVGTMCALFLCSEKFELRKKKRNIILLIAGIMSFSLAFYMIIFIYFFVNSINNKDKKKTIALGMIIVLYICFTSIQFSNPDIQRFRDRFLFVGGKLLGDNRTNYRFDNLMTGIFNDGFKSLLWGHGAGATSNIQSSMIIDGSSYKILIYDYGFFGFISQIAWLLILGFSSFGKNNKNQIMAIIVAYIANMYQRPSMFSFQFMLILFGGILIASSSNNGFLYKEEMDEKTSL